MNASAGESPFPSPIALTRRAPARAAAHSTSAASATSRATRSRFATTKQTRAVPVQRHQRGLQCGTIGETGATLQTPRPPRCQADGEAPADRGLRSSAERPPGRRQSAPAEARKSRRPGGGSAPAVHREGRRREGRLAGRALRPRGPRGPRDVRAASPRRAAPVPVHRVPGGRARSRPHRLRPGADETRRA